MRGAAAIRSARLALITAAAVACLGAAQDPLDRFLDGLHSFQASFSQQVTDTHGHTVGESTGTLIVLRPGRFRWEIHDKGETGAGQLVVDDGRNLWYYDRDLQQVTVKPASAALTATPAMLLAEGNTLDEFRVEEAGARKGLDWVRVSPKAADADFTDALLGFSGKELKRMVLKDKLGQTATLEFGRVERNVAVAPSQVSFTPPAGADVIGTPEK
jgi:outer membrane lipoprotein carrier protein